MLCFSFFSVGDACAITSVQRGVLQSGWVLAAELEDRWAAAGAQTSRAAKQRGLAR